MTTLSNEWLEKKCKDHSPRPRRQLSYILPWLGGRVINDIRPMELLARLAVVQDGGRIYSAIKALQTYGQIWRYAVATGRAERDITADLKGALQSTNKTHFSAITEVKEISGLLKAIYAFRGTLVVSSALKLSALLFQRPGEIRAMKWGDIDLDAKEWRYLVTKTQTQHIVPLSRQAIEILAGIRPLTGHGVWVFPGGRNANNTLGGRCMSENAITGALAKLGFGETMTAHGFRAMARTVLDEVLDFRPDYIEHQLCHTVRDPLGRAYNRTTHLPERHKMMQSWADYLDNLRLGTNVVAINTRKVL